MSSQVFLVKIWIKCPKTILGAIDLVYLHFSSFTPWCISNSTSSSSSFNKRQKKHHHYHLNDRRTYPRTTSQPIGMIYINFTTMIKPTQEQSSDGVEHSGRQQRCPWLPSSSCSPPWSTPEFLFSVILKAIFFILRLPCTFTVCWKGLLSQK